MTTYSISPRGESSFDPFTVEANNYSAAATMAARRLHGSQVGAMRVTGHNSMSGVFQSYVRIGRESGSTSVGGNFHVSATH
jgi:hypothetical protein